MWVVRRTTGGAYILAELDGAESKTRYAAFRVIPYYARDDHTKDMESGDRDGSVAGEGGSDDSDGEGDAFVDDGNDLLL